MSEVKKWKNIIENAMKVAENDVEDVNHTDHEVSMAKSQLLSSVKSAVRIAKHLKDLSETEGLEGWVASKMTLAEEYLQTVADYMDGEKIQEGYKVLPQIDREKYQSRDGLEGPFSTLSGKVVYYDPKEGKYYDPDTDMYMSYEEFKSLDNDYAGMKTEEKGGSVARGRAESVKNIDDILIKMGADAPGDIIADIMHWIDAHPGENLQDLIKQGEGYYQDELDESKTKIDEGYEGVIIHALGQKGIRGFFNKGTLYIEDDADMEEVEEIVNDTVQVAPEIKPDSDYYQMEGIEKSEALTEAEFDEAAGEKDACYHKVKSRYKVWPSAYASGALVKCRKVGAKNWGNSKK
tara:strand:+ start:653 stop:1699 length:1047 start_codon:yes stop_codon:yes gene_type:complete